MQSKAKDVDTYIDEVPEERREAISKLRMLCNEILDGYEESMEYGMPSYKLSGGEVEIAFASQKNYISLYILKEPVMDANRHLLEGLNLGKGCIRYTKPDKINFEIVRKMLTESRQSDSQIC